MSSCSHLDQLSRLQLPRLSQSVHREECTQCFDSQDDSQGIEVCLTCFNGGCLDPERRHALLHVSKHGHPFTLNVKRKLKPSAKRNEDEEPPAKMMKLSIAEGCEEDNYDYQTVVKCWQCDSSNGAELREATKNPQVQALVQGVMQSMSSAGQSEVKVWEEKILPCEHTLTLEQFANGPIPASGLAHCSSCDLKENLWLCLTCGSLGCGRQQFGSMGGNGHGLAHYEATQHPVSVKLGTIIPEGGADIYCYQCNDSKLDPELASHLATFGINIQTQTKTEKSMTELQIELKYDFPLTGKALEPVCGPGLTGLSNLGNSCYMASVLQTIFSLPAFQQRYGAFAQHHAVACTEPLPAECIECQMHKVADGLLSGRYSRPAHYVSSPEADTTTSVFQAGIKPTGFKALIVKGDEEFSTMNERDAEEFFTHLITALRRDGHKHKDRAEPDATSVFAYGMEQRLQCNDCKKVRYRVDNMDVVSVSVPAVEKGKDADGKTLYEEVQLWQCLESLLSVDALEYACPSCQKSVHALRQSMFASFPDVLVVHAKKFQLVNWVPAKLDIPVLLPVGDELQFTDNQLGHGLQADEVALPENEAASTTLPEFNEAAMAQLEAMGFPVVRCQKALLATGNSDPEAAMEWLFGHMEDPGAYTISATISGASTASDIDDPIQPTSSSAAASAFEPSPDQVSMLSDMGFTPAQARKALRETAGNAERAVEWLFSHPDDSGEDSSAPAATQPSEPVIGGSKTVPAIYKLKAFISHKGPSVHSGRYVAHIKVGDQWVFFNDERVVKADDESVKDSKKLAYLYIFEKV